MKPAAIVLTPHNVASLVYVHLRKCLVDLLYFRLNCLFVSLMLSGSDLRKKIKITTTNELQHAPHCPALKSAWWHGHFSFLCCFVH